MAKGPGKRIWLAQHLLKSTSLVRRLVSLSSIGPGDTVYEIGPGRGIITAELARAADHVIAIELDPQLAEFLTKKFRRSSNVRIIEGDFLRFRMPAKDHKIFANIPFNATAAIVRKILFSAPGAREAFLVVQREAARKFAGRPNETQFSILAKPWWKFRMLHRFRRTDFKPVPSVDPVLLQSHRRAPPLVEAKDARVYRRFVQYGFGRWKANLKQSFKTVFTHQQWRRLSKEFDFAMDSTPTELTLKQWVGLFECFKEQVPSFKQKRIMN